MKSVLILLTLFIFQIIFTVSFEHDIKISVDLIDSYERPTAATAFLCWSMSIKLQLTKLLGNLKRPSTIRFMNEQNRISEPVPKDTVAIVDLTCPGIEFFLKEANNSKSFGSPHRWIILGHQYNGSGVVVPLLLENMNIPFDSEVIITQGKVLGHYEIYLIYKINTKKSWLSEYYGIWTDSSGLQMATAIRTMTQTLRRRNLAGEELIVTFNVDDRSTGIYSTKSDIKIRNSIHSVTKWGFQQMLHFYQFLNATRVNLITNNWGYYINGSWNGIVGNLVRGEAELAGTAIFMAKERLEYVHYLTNAIQTSIQFVFREPPLSYQNNLFLLPFNKAVWCSIAIFVLLMTLVIYINARWETKKLEILNEEKNIKTISTKLTISDVLMMIVGAISQQGSFLELRGSIGRLVMFTLFFAFLFLFTAYSASIVALLQSSSKQIRTLSDLLNSRLELGVDNTSYNIHYFKTATDPVRKAIYETKVAPKGSKANFMSLEEGVKKLQKHPFAFNMDVGVGYRIVEKYFYEHEKCGLQEISYIPTSKPWLSCRKASPYLELFKVGICRIHEHGMNNRVNRMVYSRKPMCSVSGGSFDSVSIVDVYPSLLMLLYGTLLACALLVVEILYHRRQQMKKSEDD